MTDSIFFVKETSTCHYVMVIHTPRLCGEPGFKTRLQQREEAPIRCREILSPEDFATAYDSEHLSAMTQQGGGGESNFPFPARSNLEKRRSALGIPPPPEAKEQPSVQQVIVGKKKEDILAAFEAILGGRLQNPGQNQDGGNGQRTQNQRGNTQEQAPLTATDSPEQGQRRDRNPATDDRAKQDSSSVGSNSDGGRDGRDGSQAPEFEIEEAFLVTGEDGEAGEVVIDIKLTDWDDAENVLAHIDALLKKAEQKLQVLVDSEVKTAKRKVEEVEDALEDGVNDEAIHETSDSGTSLSSKEKAAAGKRRENPRKHVEL